MVQGPKRPSMHESMLWTNLSGFLVAIVGFDSSCRKMAAELFDHPRLEITFFLGAEAVRVMDTSVADPRESPLRRFACIVVVEHEQNSGEARSWNLKLCQAVARVIKRFRLIFVALCAPVPCKRCGHVILAPGSKE